ncbi:MAG: DUF2075 domain-containing protein [Candidatus Nomurabacteria bacterium]|nr:MAG: DUF2075 domain-containing protein [Candidatus Nomurabacteria bacterium]
MRAWCRNSVSEFLLENINSVIGELATSSVNDGFDVEQLQNDSWRYEISNLQEILPANIPCHIFFEFNIPRMGRRIDAVLLGPNFPYVFVIEYKVGADKFMRSDINQVHDYALELKNFHKGSHKSTIIPILVATEAEDTEFNIKYAVDNIAEPICVNPDGLKRVIDGFAFEGQVDGLDWENAPYEPTPTIIEAARALYRDQKVEDITRSEGGSENIKSTSSRVSDIINDSRINNKKTIIFVTGVPGAGKTLVGLNIATQKRQNTTDHAVYLSGNGPLVEVLQEALARDDVKQTGVKKGSAVTKAKTFIQNIHHFRDEALRSDTPPSEHVAIFDEAQRAWNREQTSNFMRRKKGVPDFDAAESEYLISYMDRHKDWATIVCLVGGGQEINVGESGISAWIESIFTKFPNWNIAISDKLHDKEYALPEEINEELYSSQSVSVFSELHLGVSMRSFRAENVSSFVKALLDLNHDQAKDYLEKFNEKYPIVITRDLMEAKKWVRKKARGTERYGLVASSKAMRLKPFAIDVKSEAKPIHYFLDGSDDLRSSYFLESAATEYQIQGLELDWTIVGWDADLRLVNDRWSYHDFKGHKWLNIHKEDNRVFLKNAYRVLLTRARQGMVIFIPYGNYPPDESRLPGFYDETFAYLKSLGIPELQSSEIDIGY